MSELKAQDASTIQYLESPPYCNAPSAYILPSPWNPSTGRDEVSKVHYKNLGCRNLPQSDVEHAPNLLWSLIRRPYGAHACPIRRFIIATRLCRYNRVVG